MTFSLIECNMLKTDIYFLLQGWDHCFSGKILQLHQESAVKRHIADLVQHLRCDCICMYVFARKWNCTFIVISQKLCTTAAVRSLSNDTVMHTALQPSESRDIISCWSTVVTTLLPSDEKLKLKASLPLYSLCITK